MSASGGLSPKVDPITVSVVQHRLEAIVREMGEAMLRTSYSQILNSSRDFSVSLFDGEGRLVAQTDHIPVHVGALPAALAGVRDYFGDQIRPGDLLLINDPYWGGSHLPDLTVILPIFAGDAPAFWAVNRAHHSDIGGSTHGAYNPEATEIWQEGIRVPPIKLVEEGRLRADIENMLAVNVRHLRSFLGDLRAQVGSVRVAERRLRRVLDEFGPGTAAAAMTEILDGAERQARTCIAGWREGIFHGEAILDDDGRGTEDITIRATVTVAHGEVRVDLSESDPQVRGFVNSSWPNTVSSAHYAIAYLIDPHIPKNEGCFRPVTVTAKEGTVVHPRPPAPVTFCTSHCGQEIAGAVIRALAPSCPDRVIAGYSCRFRFAITGTDPRTGKEFIWHLFLARGGGGAAKGADGWHGLGELHTVGGIKMPSVEVTEVRFPFFVRWHEFRSDSGGAGRWRGGAGAKLRMTVETATPCRLNTAGQGARHAPRGIFGGQDGKPHRYSLIRNGAERLLKNNEVGVVVQPGDVLQVLSAGGAGYGEPAERNPASRVEDLADGFITDAG
jgi:N-methylhydantoinase B